MCVYVSGLVPYSLVWLVVRVLQVSVSSLVLFNYLKGSVAIVSAPCVC